MIQPLHPLAAVGLDFARPGGGEPAQPQAVGFEHLDDRRPLGRHEVGGGRADGAADLEDGGTGNLRLLGFGQVLDSHRAGNFAEAAAVARPPIGDCLRLLPHLDANREELRGAGPAGGDHRLVRGAVHSHEPLRVPVQQLQKRPQDFIISRDARPVVLEHVHLHEHRGPVPQRRVAGGEAGGGGPARQPLARIGVILQGDER
jgi:hypothetical protein